MLVSGPGVLQGAVAPGALHTAQCPLQYKAAERPGPLRSGFPWIRTAPLSASGSRRLPQWQPESVVESTSLAGAYLALRFLKGKPVV